MIVILPTAQRMGVALPVGSNWICHTFLFLAWGQGPILSPKMQYFVLIIPFTLYYETVDKVHDVDDFKSYHFQNNSVEMTEYPIIFMLFVQFWNLYIYFQQSRMVFHTVGKIRVKFQCIYVKNWKYPFKSALISAFASDTSCMILKSKPQKLTFHRFKIYVQ